MSHTCRTVGGFVLALVGQDRTGTGKQVNMWHRLDCPGRVLYAESAYRDQ